MHSMDRSTTIIPDPAVKAATDTSSPPRRRWSDGPSYLWSRAADEDWTVASQWPALVAVLCEEVAGGTHDLDREIERLHGLGRLSHADVQSLQRTVLAMHSTGLALQRIVRLGAGLFNMSPDRIELATLARAAAHERQRELLRSCVELSFDLQRAEVWVDGAIAAGLMQAGLDWALSFSRKVRIKVTAGDAGEPARLVIRGALPLAREDHQGNRRMNDNLHWVLLRQLALCARLPIGRSSSAATESAVIEFPASIESARHS
jgi:hypothetical protein